MSRGNWNRIKRSKFFYVNAYRSLMKIILVSQLVNVFFCGLIVYTYMNKPKIDFYATNGITPPDKLTALDAPNMSSEALLPPDPPDTEGTKAIPE